MKNDKSVKEKKGTATNESKNDYGFGKKRLTDFYNRCGEFMKTSDDNDVFWEQLDRVIIDTYGFSELGRDYTDRGKAIR